MVQHFFRRDVPSRRVHQHVREERGRVDVRRQRSDDPVMVFLMMRKSVKRSSYTCVYIPLKQCSPSLFQIGRSVGGMPGVLFQELREFAELVALARSRVVVVVRRGGGGSVWKRRRHRHHRIVSRVRLWRESHKISPNKTTVFCCLGYHTKP